MVPPDAAHAFRSDGAYLITGGLGGLGLFLAEKMAGAGCGRIVLTSRSQPDSLAEDAIERIRAAGADIVVECGDVAARDTAAASWKPPPPPAFRFAESCMRQPWSKTQR